MSDLQRPNDPHPRCPTCSGATELKQILRHEKETHYFFRCVACTLVYPVIKVLGGEDPSGT